MTIRRQCVEILKQILEQSLFFNALKSQINDKDLPFANMLILTALRNLVSIREVLQKYLVKKIPNKNKAAYYALVLALTEIAYLKTPDYAVINEYVNITKKTTDKFTANMVNAVLRRISSEKENLNTLFNTTHFPQNFQNILRKDYTLEQILNMEKMLSVEPPLDLTINGNEEEIAKRLNGVLLPNGSIRLNKINTKISELYGFKEGLWWVQDFAASLPIFLLKNVKGKKVLDLCAAPGGKTAQLLARGAKVTALDVDKERMVRLKNNIKRLNLEQNLQTEVADALEFLAHSNEVFDIIVLDAPCSATGTFRRHPEVLHIKTTDDVKNALVLQEKMLDAVSSHMAKDGILLYCTCSIAKDEGENQIKRFLERHPEFELLPFEDKELKVVEEKIIDNGVLRTLPYYMKEKGGMDAFFATRLQKKA